MARRLNSRRGSGGPRPERRRRITLALLAVVVLVIHGGVTRNLADRMLDFAKDSAMPPRIEVAYVREMTLAAPPPTAAPTAPPAPPPARPRPIKRPKPPKPASAPPVTEPAVAAASAPDDSADHAAAEAAAADEALAQAGAPVASAASPVAAAASAPEPAAAASDSPVVAAAPASGASAPVAFEWPASTRLSYTLTGNYRGEVNGSAQVEWIRAGARYQVHLDLVVGPSAAPIITRRMSSDGEITAEGLAPRRYDQDTKAILRDRSRVTLTFEPDAVVLANGERRARVPGVQDTASQFVQLTYVFSTRPELLRIGGTVDIPLALPHKVDVWTYDVVDEEILNTAFGPLPSIHLKPRPRPVRKANELSAEIWFAPQLRYLPVRIRIEQDAATYVDLMIARRPEIGAP